MNDARHDRDVPISVIVGRLMVFVTIFLTFFCAFFVSALASIICFCMVGISLYALRLAESAEKKEDRPS